MSLGYMGEAARENKPTVRRFGCSISARTKEAIGGQVQSPWIFGGWKMRPTSERCVGGVASRFAGESLRFSMAYTADGLSLALSCLGRTHVLARWDPGP